MKLKSWKTTLAGLISAIGVWAAKQPDPWWLYQVGEVLQMLGVFMLGAVARDNNVPSEAVPKATERAHKIDEETKLHPPTP